MNADAPFVPERAANLGGDLARALALALAWSSEIAARFGRPSGVVPTLVAALGCTALTLGSVAVVARRGRTTGMGLRASVLGALLASGPVALFAAVLRGKTHHRALGGVTFALLAGALVVLGFLVVRRALAPSSPGSRAGSALRVCLAILVVTSLGVALWPLVLELGPSGSAAGRWFAEDLAIGAGLSALVAALPGIELRPRAALACAIAWALSVAAGASVVGGNMPLRAILAEHAPVGLGVLGVLGEL
jgi:hypothetical protein